MPRGVYQRQPMTTAQKRKLSFASSDFHNGVTRTQSETDGESEVSL